MKKTLATLIILAAGAVWLLRKYSRTLPCPVCRCPAEYSDENYGYICTNPRCRHVERNPMMMDRPVSQYRAGRQGSLPADMFGPHPIGGRSYDV